MREITKPRAAQKIRFPREGRAGSIRAACVSGSGPAEVNSRVHTRTDRGEERLREEIVGLAKQYGRYGYRRITALLRRQGWRVNHKRVERIWSQEGLKIPKKPPKRGRLWLNDGSCVRLRPTPNPWIASCIRIE